MYKYQQDQYKTPFAVACAIAGCATLAFILSLVVVRAQSAIIADNTVGLQELRTEVNKADKTIDKLSDKVIDLQHKVEKLPQ